MAVTATMPVPAQPPSPASELKTEAGLRVCPRCGKPVHLSSIVCRDCGAHVPKR
jgi:predicted amidophosphoribosyltransferase